jgi:uncharacterized protein YndB with AHSA1/START domain
MVETAVILVIVLIGAVLVSASTRPDTFRVERSIRIDAPPERIFAHINDLTKWEAWSPWEKMDPTMKKTLSGAPQGKGAVCEWIGNNKVGHGRMEILESVPASRVRIKLDFFKPFEAHNQAEFALAPSAGSTQVTWAMFGPQPYMAKVMSLLINCEQMVGPQFETGLANLKALTEE